MPTYYRQAKSNAGAGAAASELRARVGGDDAQFLFDEEEFELSFIRMSH